MLERIARRNSRGFRLSWDELVKFVAWGTGLVYSTLHMESTIQVLLLNWSDCILVAFCLFRRQCLYLHSKSVTVMAMAKSLIRAEFVSTVFEISNCNQACFV